MIQVLLEKIGGILEKEFLFGSFLPALLFVAAVVLTGAGVLGFEASLSWAAQRGPLDKVLLPAAIAIAIIVFAYALSAIRPLMLRVWSGQATPFVMRPLVEVARGFARRDYLRRRADAAATNRWAPLPEWFANEADSHWSASAVPATKAQVEAIRAAVALVPDADVETVKKQLQTHFLDALAKYSGESLSEVYQELKQELDDRHETEEIRLQTIRLRLDRSYGSLACVQPTRIGNIIEAYSAYSYTRYRIEPEVFWPHLQQHIGEALKAQLSEARTTLNFALTLATLACTYGVLCLGIGPHLWYSRVWLVLAALAFVVAWVGYRVGIVAAEAFGNAFRACFDVHRFDLLRSLRRTTPPTLLAERGKWEQISRLVLYGETTVDEWEITPEAPK